MPFVAADRFPLPWYFGASALLGEGSTFLPGNWWRIVQSNNLPQNEQGRLMWQLESVFEEIRLKHAPEAPSRQACLFACPTQAAATRFSNSQGSRRDVWYKVEPIEKLERIFLARWNLVDWRDMKESTSLRARAQAKRYWTEEEQDGPIEILLTCAVRVVGRL